MTEVAIQYVNFCDASFDEFLNEKISSTGMIVINLYLLKIIFTYSFTFIMKDDEEGKQVLGRVRYEINLARKGKLMEADKILRGILSAGGLKQMEAKLTYHLRKSEIDMAFMVILQLNIADAIEGNATTAVQVMTHLETMITEYQDALVSPPVRLLRLLIRTDDSNVRKQMLRQKLLIGSNIVKDSTLNQQSEVTLIEAKEKSIEAKEENCLTPSNDCCGGNDMNHDHSHDHSHAESTLPVAKSADPLPTSSPQCEFIVVEPVKVWGGADVVVTDLEATIDDILEQMSREGPEADARFDLESKCEVLRREIREVIAEVDAPKVNDIPDNCETKKIN